MPQDNWANKTIFRCGTCSYFVVKEDMKLAHKTLCLGRCRRHAPGTFGAGWPVVFPADFCGDHKLGNVPGQMEE